MRRISALFLASALAGCTVGPDFQPPTAPVTASYLSSSDPYQTMAAVPSGHPDAEPSGRWWASFRSPELDALVDRALAHNYSLEASNATLAASRDALLAVEGTRLPQISANARTEQEQINLANYGFEGLVPTGNPEFHLYSVGGGVSYDLDLFGRVRRQVEQGAARAESQQRQTEAAHLAVAGQVVNQVLTIAAIHARIATARSLLSDDQRNVDLTQKRRQGGEGTLVEVLNAQSQYSADQNDLPQLEQQLAEARHMLAILLAIPPADLGPTDFELNRLVLPANVPVALPSALVHRRPDILQAEADLHSATAAIGVATARLYPDISIGATLEQAAPNVRNLAKGAFRGYDLFAAFTTPIFDGGTLKAQREGAVADARAADATYRQTVLQAFGQVADLLSALQSDAMSVANEQQSVAVAQRSLGMSRRSFEVGNSSILQVLDSEQLYQHARTGLVSAQARQYLDVSRLYVATAGGWIPPTPAGPSSANAGSPRSVSVRKPAAAPVANANNDGKP